MSVRIFSLIPSVRHNYQIQYVDQDTALRHRLYVDVGRDTHVNKREPQNHITNKLTCAPSGDSDQPGHQPVWSESSLFACRNIGPLTTYWVHSEDSDQTWWMHRLIWDFAGPTSHFVSFVVQRLRFSMWIKIQLWNTDFMLILIVIHTSIQSYILPCISVAVDRVCQQKYGHTVWILINI